jgi:acyl-CoA thioesterase-2
MEAALTNLLTMLELESLAPDVYRGPAPGGSRRRIFGGHAAAQAVMAAGHSTPGSPVNSLHLYFLRPGDPQTPIDYRVERLRDGRSFATRLVRASQGDQVILHASLSFARPQGRGLEHQITMPDVPPPAACPRWDEWVGPRLAQMTDEARAQFVRERPIE